MAYKINLESKSYKVDTGKYGVFEVRPMGSGEELEMMRVNREASEISREIISLQKESEGLEDGEKLDGINNKVQDLVGKVESMRVVVAQILKNTFSPVDDANLEKLFAEIPLIKLREIATETINYGIEHES